MLKHILRKRFPHIGDKLEDMQKQIYDMKIISSEDLASFINRAAILHNKCVLSRQDVSPNLLFKQFFTKLMACQGFLLFLAPSTQIFFIFNANVVVKLSMTKIPYTPYTITLKPPWPLLSLSLKQIPPTLFHPTFP